MKNILKNIVKNPLKTGLATILLISNMNCKHPFLIKTQYKDMRVIARVLDSGDWKAIDLSTKKDRIGNRDYIYAHDTTGDGSFNKIEPIFPQGSDLEKYNNLDSLEHIYQIVKAEFEAENSQLNK